MTPYWWENAVSTNQFEGNQNSIIKIVILYLLLIRISCFGYVTNVINANVVIGQGMDNLSGCKIKRNMRNMNIAMETVTLDTL